MKLTSNKAGVRLIFLLLSLLVLVVGAWEINCRKQIEENALKVAQNEADSISTCPVWKYEK